MSLMLLAPVDYVFTGPVSCPISYTFAYKQRLEPKRVQQGLSQLVEHTPWLGGRLRAVSDAQLAFEVSDKPSLDLEVASSNKTFSELSIAEGVRLVRSYADQPLAHARLTQTPSGSVLGVSVSHALVDGFSYFQAMACWAAWSRGQATPAPPMQRMLVPSQEHVRDAQPDLSARSLLEATGMFWAQPRKVLSNPPMQEAVHLSAAELDQMIAEAQRGISVRLRQNDVLTAWLWRKYGANWWAAHSDTELYMSCPVDLRRNLGKAGAAAFGCNITNASARATLQELEQLPLGSLALRVQDAVAHAVADDWRARIAPLDALRRAHGLEALRSVHMRHPDRGMLVTNMSRLPLGDLDFGCGAPHDFKSFGPLESVVSVLPAKSGVRLSVFAPQHAAANAPQGERSAGQSRARIGHS